MDDPILRLLKLKAPTELLALLDEYPTLEHGDLNDRLPRPTARRGSRAGS